MEFEVRVNDDLGVSPQEFELLNEFILQGNDGHEGLWSCSVEGVRAIHSDVVGGGDQLQAFSQQIVAILGGCHALKVYLPNEREHSMLEFSVGELRPHGVL